MSELNHTVTASGRDIYLIPVRSFVNLVTNLFVIDDGDYQSSLTVAPARILPMTI